MKTLLLFLLFVSGVCWAQVTTKDEKPKTKLETFLAQDGVMIVQGISTIGQLAGTIEGSLTVKCRELFTATAGKKEYGITIEVKQPGRIARESISYVDYDEIDSILKGIDYISKIDKTVTKLDLFQADYRTRGNLKLSAFNGKEGVILSIESGTMGSASVDFDYKNIGRVRDLIVAAKQKLDSIK